MTAHLHRHTQTHSHTHTLTHAHQQQQQFPRPRTTNASGSSEHRTHAWKHSCSSGAKAICTSRGHRGTPANGLRLRLTALEGSISRWLIAAGLLACRRIGAVCLFWLALTTCWFALALALASTTRTVFSPLPSSLTGFSPHVPLLRRPIQRAVAARVIGLRARHRLYLPWAQPMDALWKVGGWVAG